MATDSATFLHLTERRQTFAKENLKSAGEASEVKSKTELSSIPDEIISSDLLNNNAEVVENTISRLQILYLCAWVTFTVP